MSLDEIDAFLAQDPDQPRGPTNLELDRLAAGELDADAARALEAEVMADPALANTLKRRRLGPDAITDVDTDALLARIKGELGTPAAPAESWWRKCTRSIWFAPGLLVAGAAAAVAIMAVRPTDTPGIGAGPVTDGVRAKGSLRLQVVRQTPDGSEQMISGATFKPNDTLRFKVDAPAAGVIRVVGVERDGTLFTAWPLPEHPADAARLSAKRKGHLLPGSVELDGTPGRETLYLVHCPDGVDPACTSTGADTPPACPAGCASSPFTIVKGG